MRRISPKNECNKTMSESENVKIHETETKTKNKTVKTPVHLFWAMPYCQKQFLESKKKGKFISNSYLKILNEKDIK